VHSSRAVLYITHFVDETVETEFRKLHADLRERADALVLFNTPDRARVPERLEALPNFVTIESELMKLPFVEKLKLDLHGYNMDLPVIAFFQANPHYQYYWVIEYDVRFSGDWRRLLEGFEASEADLLCTNLYRFSVNPTWHRRYPAMPPAGQSVRDEERVHAFLPIYRISAGALTRLVEAYKEGWSGLYEATVPTILERAGYTLEDFGGDGEFVRQGNRNKYYLSSHRTQSMSPGTFVFRPVFLSPGRRPNTLWHPVKPGFSFKGEPRRQRVLRYAYRLLLPLRIALGR
jgi:hypothetical protein